MEKKDNYEKQKRNLKSFNTMTKEEAKAIQSLGGKKGAESKRARKKLKEELTILLEICDKRGITNNEKMCLAILKEAKEGNVKAFEVIRDTIGEKPVDRTEVNVVDTSWFIDDEETK